MLYRIVKPSFFVGMPGPRAETKDPLVSWLGPNPLPPRANGLSRRDEPTAGQGPTPARGGTEMQGISAEANVLDGRFLPTLAPTLGRHSQTL